MRQVAGISIQIIMALRHEVKHGVNAGIAVDAANDVYITARIKARVVKLSQKDWIAIALQSTASDT